VRTTEAKAGDTVRFRLTDEGVLLDKAIEAGDRSQRFPNDIRGRRKSLCDL